MAVYPGSARERAMKAQEVILRFLSKQITFWQAAKILRVSPRHLRRIMSATGGWGMTGCTTSERCAEPEARGAGGGGASAGAVPREVFRFQRAAFSREAARGAWHRIELHVGEAGIAGSGAGEKAPQRGVHRRRRERRPMTGMLLHIDGSTHRGWAGSSGRSDRGAGRCQQRDLLRATGGAGIDETVMAALREVVEQRGIFCSLYSDRASTSG